MSISAILKLLGAAAIWLLIVAVLGIVLYLVFRKKR
jgi:hypothetical protein